MSTFRFGAWDRRCAPHPSLQHHTSNFPAFPNRLSKRRDAQEASKKPLSVSLFIVGEYDILNDLVNDGAAEHLRDNRDAADCALLLQNDPCPPPDRWVRSTGWGGCNPSSN